MKKLFSVSLLVFAIHLCFAQNFTKEELRFLKKKEDSLKGYALNIIQGINSLDRFNADSQFTRTFVRALLTNYMHPTAAFAFIPGNWLSMTMWYGSMVPFRCAPMMAH